jgi:hypothetical protein
MARDRSQEAKALFEDLSKPDVAEGPPDLLILDRQICFSVNGTLRSWKAGVPITKPADIADLSTAPGKRYRLIR